MLRAAFFMEETVVGGCPSPLLRARAHTLGGVQTVKTEAALVPHSPLVSLVPMMDGSYIGGSPETPISRLAQPEHHWV